MTEENAEIDLNSIPVELPYGLPSTIISGRSQPKTAALFQNKSEENYTSSKHRHYRIELTESIFFSTLEIYAEGYSDGNKLDFEYTSTTSQRAESIEGEYSQGRFVVQIDDFVEAFTFRPQRRWTAGLLTKITATGFEKNSIRSHFKEVVHFANRSEQLRTTLQKERDAVNEKNRQFEATNEEAKSLQVQIDKLNAQKSALEEEVLSTGQAVQSNRDAIKNTQSTIQQLKTEKNQVESVIKERQDEQRSLVDSIRKKEMSLKDLENDINLFPSEIAGYAQQGGRNIGLYTGLAVIPIVVILTLSGYLLFSAKELTQFFVVEHEYAVSDYIISRIPFVTLVGGIITACYKITRYFVDEIIRINRQRLDLTKISVLARDVSNAAAHEIALTSEQQHENQMRLKMDLLRAHFAKELPSTYEYKPSLKTTNDQRSIDPKVENVDEVHPSPEIEAPGQ